MDKQRQILALKYKELSDKLSEQRELLILKPTWYNKLMFKRTYNKLLKMDRAVPRFHRPFGNYKTDYDFSKLKA